MDGRKETRIKKLSDEQAQAARKLEANKSLAPWQAATNKNTRRDLRTHNAIQILARVEAALAVEGCPAEELKEIRAKTNTFQMGMDYIRNAGKRQKKYRDELERIYFEINHMISDLANKKGFNLFEDSTWQLSNTLGDKELKEESTDTLL